MFHQVDTAVSSARGLWCGCGVAVPVAVSVRAGERDREREREAEWDVGRRVDSERELALWARDVDLDVDRGSVSSRSGLCWRVAMEMEWPR